MLYSHASPLHRAPAALAALTAAALLGAALGCPGPAPASDAAEAPQVTENAPAPNQSGGPSAENPAPPAAPEATPDGADNPVTPPDPLEPQLAEDPAPPTGAPAPNAAAPQEEPAEAPQAPEEQKQATAPAEPKPAPATPENAPAAAPEPAAPQPEAQTPIDQPEPPTGPDMTRAEETGMPMAGGVSADPVEVLLDVVLSQQQAGSNLRVAAADHMSGKIAYEIRIKCGPGVQPAGL